MKTIPWNLRNAVGWNVRGDGDDGGNHRASGSGDPVEHGGGASIHCLRELACIPYVPASHLPIAKTGGMAADPTVVPFAWFAERPSCFPYDLSGCDYHSTDRGQDWYG